jgi:hypothetical protein
MTMEKSRQDAKTTRWYMRHHKREHEKAYRFGGYPFGDERCPICQMWHRVFDLKLAARRLKHRFEVIAARSEKFQELLEEMEW